MINIVCTQCLCYYLFGLIYEEVINLTQLEYMQGNMEEKIEWKFYVECATKIEYFIL